jgi:hypothetical protein
MHVSTELRVIPPGSGLCAGHAEVNQVIDSSMVKVKHLFSAKKVGDA